MSQQLQPLLLLEELKHHYDKSILQQRHLKIEDEELDDSMTSETEASSTTSSISVLSWDDLLKQEHEYYLKKSKELRLLCAASMQSQRAFIATIDFTPDYDKATALQVAQEMAQVITLVRTLQASVSQLEREAQFVVSYNLLNKLADLDNMAAHLQILANELQSLTQAGVGCPYAVLVFARQPFPGILKRYKQIPSDEFIVELLTTTQFPYTYSKLRVIHDEFFSPTNTLLNSNSNSNNNNNFNNNNFNNSINNSNNNSPLGLNDLVSPPLSNQANTTSLFEQELFEVQQENGRFLAKIPIKLMQGTTRFSSLRFSLVLTHKSTKHQYTIETGPSDRFISFVNDSQWVECFGLLLKEEIFLFNQGRFIYDKVNHTRVLNVLAKYFHLCLKIYKRSTSNHRSLPIEPLKLVLNKLSRDNNININQFEEFMKIMTPPLKVIKYQRHALELWNQGLIFLFIDEEEVKQLLISSRERERKSGRFLIHFSIDHPYCWIIKYVDGENDEQVVQQLIIDMKIDLIGDRSSKSLVNYIETNLIDLKEICQFDAKQNTISFINRDDAFSHVKSNLL